MIAKQAATHSQEFLGVKRHDLKGIHSHGDHSARQFVCSRRLEVALQKLRDERSNSKIELRDPPNLSLENKISNNIFKAENETTRPRVNFQERKDAPEERYVNDTEDQRSHSNERDEQETFNEKEIQACMKGSHTAGLSSPRAGHSRAGHSRELPHHLVSPAKKKVTLNLDFGEEWCDSEQSLSIIMRNGSRYLPKLLADAYVLSEESDQDTTTYNGFAESSYESDRSSDGYSTESSSKFKKTLTVDTEDESDEKVEGKTDSVFLATNI